MKNRVISFLFILFGISMLYSAVHFSVFEPNAFKGYGDFLNAIIKTAQVIVGLIADISGIISLFKKEPPALAITPDTAKLSLDLPLIGRDNDLQWLQVNEGDCVLVGQPGSGKTFLLYKFAKQGNGLFVNDFNIGRITREYKRKKPKTIIIDDAQLHLDLIHKLVNYRKNNSATFRILASCWPNHEAMILIALNLPASNSQYKPSYFGPTRRSSQSSWVDGARWTYSRDSGAICW